jgi:choline dehydrogenase-like flavoprotein
LRYSGCFWQSPSVNLLYVSEPGHGIGGRAIAVPRGKTLGGSSSINGHIYNRGQRMDFDSWAQAGNRGLGYFDVLPYFKRCEQRIGPCDDTFRGRSGNLQVTDFDYRHPLADALIKGAAEIGIPHNPDYNGERQEGISYVQRTTIAAAASRPHVPSSTRPKAGRTSPFAQMPTPLSSS